METAQRRGAVGNEKFHFRKYVYPVGRGGSEGSIASSSPINRFAKKEKKLGNCFPPLPTPHNGVKFTGPVEEEYEEMSMNEIINGKVLVDFL